MEQGELDAIRAFHRAEAEVAETRGPVPVCAFWDDSRETEMVIKTLDGAYWYMTVAVPVIIVPFDGVEQHLRPCNFFVSYTACQVFVQGWLPV